MLHSFQLIFDHLVFYFFFFFRRRDAIGVRRLLDPCIGQLLGSVHGVGLKIPDDD